ncbi:MAG: hypothetical protein ACR2HJ_03780 [Fimbriimonadales bacterium]
MKNYNSHTMQFVGGRGWFADQASAYGAVGYEFNPNMGAEVGFQIAPETGSVDNHSFYAAVAFRM